MKFYRPPDPLAADREGRRLFLFLLGEDLMLKLLLLLRRKGVPSREVEEELAPRGGRRRRRRESGAALEVGVGDRGGRQCL